MRNSAPTILSITTLLSGVSLSAGSFLSFTDINSHWIDGASRMIGWQFTVNQPVVTDGLGWFDYGLDGLATPHEVGIWDRNTQALVAHAIVPSGTSAPLDSWFRYADLTFSVTLQPGTPYLIAGFDPGLDAHVWDNLVPGSDMQVDGFSVDPIATLGAPGTAVGPGASEFGYTGFTIGDERQALMGPNIRYTAVPEPASCAAVASLALLAFSVWRRTSPKKL